MAWASAVMSGLLLCALLASGVLAQHHPAQRPHEPPQHHSLRHHQSHARSGKSTNACYVPVAKLPGEVLVSGASSRKNSVDECREACQVEWECTAWVWCDDPAGCTDETMLTIPHKGCQLKAERMEPTGAPDEAYMKGWKPSTYFAGYVKRRQQAQNTFIRLHSAPTTKLLIASSAPPKGCPLADGDLHSALSTINKRDYAKWHSYEFHLAPSLPIDPELRPEGSHDLWAWNKVAQLRAIMDRVPPEHAEWILYMQPDTNFDDIAFTFPFEMYRGKDFVAVGDAERIRKGDESGVDMGVFLLRNNEAMRELLDALASHAKALPFAGEEAYNVDPLARAVAQFVSKDTDKWLDHFNFRSEICLSCDFRSLDLTASRKEEVMKSWGSANRKWNLFISRFYKCATCYDSGLSSGELEECRNSHLAHFEFAYCRFYKLEQASARERQLGGLQGHMGEMGVPPAHIAFMTPQQGADTPRNHAIKAAVDHHTGTAQECWQRCMSEAACEFWVWCGYEAGCDDQGDFNGRYPFRGCELMSLPKGQHVDQWDRGPVFSTFESGYKTARHQSFTGSPQEAKSRVAILTGIPTSPCTNPYGDYFLGLSMRNKQDWARLHSHELHLMAASVDSTIRPGPWQKIALLRNALHGIPRERAEWILWLDMDLLINNIGFHFPLDKYEGKDVIMHGNREDVAKGEARKGMNSGVLLLRNTDYNRDLMHRMAAYGAFPMDYNKEEALRADLPSYEVGLYEQNVLTYLWYKQPSLMETVYFDDRSYGINCWWKDVDSPYVDKPAFIIHFAGCSMCSGFHPERLGDCDGEFLRTFGEAQRRLAAAAEEAHLRRLALEQDA